MESNIIRVSTMKKLIIVILFLIGMLNHASGQDIITLKNGEEIKSKVIDNGSNVIRYVKFESQSGPIFALEKTDIFMIKYENGTKDVFDYQPITPAVKSWQNELDSTAVEGKLTFYKKSVMKEKRILMPYEVKTIMNSNRAALKRYKGGRAFNTLGIIFFAIGGVDAVGAISNAAHGYNATVPFVAAGIEIGIGVLFNSISIRKTQSSVIIYNLGLKKKNSTNLDLGLNRDGLGLCFNF
jgi:hypothetical protein